MSMESLLSLLQVLLEAYFSLELEFMSIFSLQENIDSFAQFHKNGYISRFMIDMKVRFVSEFSRLETLQKSWRRFCPNILRNALFWTFKMMYISSSFRS